MRIVLLPNFQKKDALKTSVKTIQILKQLNCSVYSTYEKKSELCKSCNIEYGNISDICNDADFIVAIGGDGTILKASAYACKYDKPLLGINTGRLGFMASMEVDELDDLSKLTTGDYSVVDRMMLSATINADKNYLALNDIVISSPYSNLTDYYINIDNKLVSEIRADGVVFSTPTGSTAYALSAGGPIIEPKMECIELTPICPQSLCSRTMIFSADNILDISFSVKKSNDIIIIIDGQEKVKLQSDDKITITKSDKFLKLIDIKGNSFFDAVNNKLMNSIKG